MRQILMIALAAAALAVAGCGPKVMVNGESYYALTAEEEQMLVAHARATLRHSPKSVAPEMLRYALENQPTVKIDYAGDRAGNARVEWRHNDKLVALVYSGIFLTSKMFCVMEARDLFDGTIDYTKDKPVRLKE